MTTDKEEKRKTREKEPDLDSISEILKTREKEPDLDSISEIPKSMKANNAEEAKK
jgi:hypothetical protein